MGAFTKLSKQQWEILAEVVRDHAFGWAYTAYGARRPAQPEDRTPAREAVRTSTIRSLASLVRRGLIVQTEGLWGGIGYKLNVPARKVLLAAQENVDAFGEQAAAWRVLYRLELHIPSIERKEVLQRRRRERREAAEKALLPNGGEPPQPYQLDTVALAIKRGIKWLQDQTL